MVLRQSAISLLVNCIVVADIRHRGYRHRHAIKIRVAKNRIEARGTSTAPSPDADAGRIDEWPFDDRPDSVSLILRVQHTHPAVDRLAPRSASRSRGASIVYANDNVTLLPQHRVPHTAEPSPCVEHGLPPGFAVDMKQHRVAFLRVEVGRLDHPAVELHTIADIHAEELRLALSKFAQSLLQVSIINQHSQLRVLWQPDDLHHRGHGEGRISMDRQIAAGRNEVAVRTRLACRGKFLGRPGAVEPRTEKVTLSRVVRRCRKIEPAASLNNPLDADYIITARCNASHILAV